MLVVAVLEQSIMKGQAQIVIPIVLESFRGRNLIQNRCNLLFVIDGLRDVRRHGHHGVHIHERLGVVALIKATTGHFHEA